MANILGEHVAGGWVLTQQAQMAQEGMFDAARMPHIEANARPLGDMATTAVETAEAVETEALEAA
jgi:hypothetical protein